MKLWQWEKMSFSNSDIDPYREEILKLNGQLLMCKNNLIYFSPELFYCQFNTIVVGFFRHKRLNYPTYAQLTVQFQDIFAV